MGKEKRKKSRKKEKKHKKRKVSTSGSSTDSSEGEWVEKGRAVESPRKLVATETDCSSDWGAVFSGKSTADIRRAKEEDKLRLKAALPKDGPGQSSRELNPYWKNGGTGLPPERPVSSQPAAGGSRGSFRRPGDDDLRPSPRPSSSASSSRGGWRKTTAPPAEVSRTPPIKESRQPPEESRAKSPKPEAANQLSALKAKIMRAELAGKTGVVDELKEQLRAYEEASRTVTLTETDSRGFTRPVRRQDSQATGASSGSRAKKRVPTHSNSERVRYFADDDDYSLQDMFEREKSRSSHDQDAVFVDLMGRELARKDGSLALDDPFEETASIDDRERRKTQHRARAIRDQEKKEKSYDECKWCLGARRMNEKLVVANKGNVYLSCPPFQSLTKGHCLIIPNGHVSCSVQADEDVWADVIELRKELVRRFASRDEDVLFYEKASHLHKHPHMLLHCVPVPREIGDLAPIYFKKALLDCETEWSENKKVVELRGRGLRKAVPNGLPYFFVDFGNQDGYAHVIEDQQLFPNNFAPEIVGGMLDLDHGLWRKQRNASQQELDDSLKYLKDLMSSD